MSPLKPPPRQFYPSRPETLQKQRELNARVATSSARAGDPVPELTLPDGDLQLASGKILRYVTDIPGPGPRNGTQRCWDEHPHRDGPERKGMRVLASLDRPPYVGEDQWLLHVSISYPGSLPSWREVRMVKDVLYGPDVDACMILPREAHYGSVHDFCLNLWQLPRVWGIAGV